MTLAAPASSLPTFANRVADCAWRAMLTEVNLTPKPGLVDTRNTGAHLDMDLQLFHRSASAIACTLPQLFELGASCAQLAEKDTLPILRTAGYQSEMAMYHATAGINTHKGTVFILGLFCAAAGRHHALGLPFGAASLAKTVAGMCHGLIERELSTLSSHIAQTAGQRLYLEYGLTGARGEAEHGYPLIIRRSLPCYRQYRREGMSDTLALHNTLLQLIAHNKDTNVVSRGGLSALNWIQQRARAILAVGGIRSTTDFSLLEEFDDECISRNISPGGSADLLMLTWFLFHFCAEEE